MIATALACSPDLLIADEPTTALDVTVERQILALLQVLRRETGSAMLLITHNLALIAEHCDRIAVMYAGQIVEMADTAGCSPTRHPYTRALGSIRGAHLGAPAAIGPAGRAGERAARLPARAAGADGSPRRSRGRPRSHLVLLPARGQA
jgi:ABC-type glutathione transport system ATPase component